MNFPIVMQPEEDIVDFRGWNGSSVKNDVLLVLESKSTKVGQLLSFDTNL
jgi:hypothetical protein